MIWVRAGLLAAVVGLIVAVLTETAARPMADVVAPTETPAPTPRPTRIPLPTARPEMVISRVARQTPVALPAPIQSSSPWVEVVDYGYSPAQVQVQLGANVTWSNSGNDGHDVSGTGPGGQWRSGPLAPGERFTQQFNLAGTYDYVCDFHPEMRGRIVVQP